MKFLESSWGYSFEDQNILVGFCNSSMTWDDLKKKWPDLSFHRLQQTHSQILLKTSRNLPELGPQGDALWTDEPDLALAVQTADCLPLLVHSKSEGRVAAIHAGWRGVANQIAVHTVQQVFSGSSVDIYLGPYIHFSSFEVQKDVRDLILGPLIHSAEIYSRPSNENRFLLDLKTVLLEHLKAATKNQFKVHDLNIDTRSSAVFASHRREPQNLARNFNFIAMKSP